ncbi:hypothetical protein V2W30_10515 [Streptomyces sp. Q6]|uniref:Uncharacterized protein n=1 Tax=Streptomyces citrinus TaxID=3118173 RepID=A0ACD5A929_9ACTN
MRGPAPGGRRRLVQRAAAGEQEPAVRSALQARALGGVQVVGAESREGGGPQHDSAVGAGSLGVALVRGGGQHQNL